MRRCAIAVVAFVAVSAFGAAWAQDGAALVKAIQGGDRDARMAAVEQLSQMGAAAIEPLFGLIGGEDKVADRLARRAVEAITQRAAAPEAEADRTDVAAALLRQAKSRRPAAARHFALRMLSFVGGDGEVASLRALLRDPDAREMARWALVRIPGDKALNALAVAASTEKDPAFKAALITSLGARGHPRALPAIRHALRDSNQPVRLAAIEALGAIPHPEAEEVLREAASSGARARMAGIPPAGRVAPEGG
jgi:hypothetical protein